MVQPKYGVVYAQKIFYQVDVDKGRSERKTAI